MMNTYVILLRGINVGGKNKVPMAGLRKCLEVLGFANVSTYLDNELIKVLVLTPHQLQAVIDNKPEGFGELSLLHCCQRGFLNQLKGEYGKTKSTHNVSITGGATEGILSTAREDQFDEGWIPGRSYEAQIP